jgi:hypothetical protein
MRIRMKDEECKIEGTKIEYSSAIDVGNEQRMKSIQWR